MTRRILRSDGRLHAARLPPEVCETANNHEMNDVNGDVSIYNNSAQGEWAVSRSIKMAAKSEWKSPSPGGRNTTGLRYRKRRRGRLVPAPDAMTFAIEPLMTCLSAVPGGMTVARRMRATCCSSCVTGSECENSSEVSGTLPCSRALSPPLLPPPFPCEVPLPLDVLGRLPGRRLSRLLSLMRSWYCLMSGVARG